MNGLHSDLVLALDLGGTKLEAALVDADSAIVPGTRHRAPTGPGLDPAGLTVALMHVCGAALAAAPPGAVVRAAGMGTAGPIDKRTGAIGPVNMPGIHGFRLNTAVESVLAELGMPHRPVRIGHDGGCLALAEALVGATRDARVSLSMVVSTGIGGGIVIDGQLASGTSGNAGHIGQMHPVGGDGLTLEEIAAGPASVAWARAQGWSGESGEDLSTSAAAGDSLARAAIERSARAVGAMLADVSTLLDLETVAIGGGFSRVSDDYVDLVGAALQASAGLAYVRNTRVVRTGLREDGPLLGAAALVSEA